jgi:RES domain-containing protein
MIVYRISNEIYKDDLSGNGAAINGSRWNSKSLKLLYASQHISLCILESLVHLKTSYIPEMQYLLHIQMPETAVQEITFQKMREDWKTDFVYTQWLGDQFIISNKSLVLKVPSAIVPQEHNILINPLHKDFKRVKIIGSELLELDKRLFQTG